MQSKISEVEEEAMKLKALQEKQKELAGTPGACLLAYIYIYIYILYIEGIHRKRKQGNQFYNLNPSLYLFSA